MISIVTMATIGGMGLGVAIGSLFNTNNIKRETLLMKGHIHQVQQAWQYRNEAQLNFYALQEACRQLRMWEHEPAMSDSWYWIGKAKEKYGYTHGWIEDSDNSSGK